MHHAMHTYIYNLMAELSCSATPEREYAIYAFSVLDFLRHRSSVGFVISQLATGLAFAEIV